MTPIDATSWAQILIASKFIKVFVNPRFLLAIQPPPQSSHETEVSYRHRERAAPEMKMLCKCERKAGGS